MLVLGLLFFKRISQEQKHLPFGISWKPKESQIRLSAFPGAVRSRAKIWHFLIKTSMNKLLLDHNPSIILVVLKIEPFVVFLLNQRAGTTQLAS